jgi:nucleoside recognition membrane protein YjiH
VNTAVTQTRKNSTLLSYFSLFTSVGTLLCCALPSLLVLLGLGASVASMLSFLPWLVTLSRHKQWTFLISGILIAFSFVNMYYLAPRLKAQQCVPDNPSACEESSKLSRVLLWVSAGMYSGGFFVAYALGPILTRLDR